MTLLTYRGRKLSAISFPIGGLGTGNINLNGYGEFILWEIFNRPNKEFLLPYTFPLLRISDGKKIWSSILASLPSPPYTYDAQGYRRWNGEGLPHLAETVFKSQFPFAFIDFKDKHLPISLELEAFNPFIPHNVKDSGIPCGIFTYIFRNLSERDLDISVSLSLLNAVGWDSLSKLDGRFHKNLGGNVNTFKEEGQLKGIYMFSEKYGSRDPRYGSMALGVIGGKTSYRTSWMMLKSPFLGFAEMYDYWNDFTTDGLLQDSEDGESPSPDGCSRVASLCTSVSLKPGETKKVIFIFTWFMPNRRVTWHKDPPYKMKHLKNWYSTQWDDAWDVMRYVYQNLERLRQESITFAKTLHSSTFPIEVIDAVSSNLSTLKTNTCFLLDTGELMCFEGSSTHEGCCPMNCTHVFNYEQAIAFLFPELERSMRYVDFLHNLEEDGKMAFRTRLPLKYRTPWKFHPAADGQMGCILKVYREWLLSGDDEFLQKLWPYVKKTLHYAWKKWDPDMDGVMESDQHNTYDIEFYGANTMMGSLYLGALKAAANMAKYLGDKDYEIYLKLFKKGSRKLDTLTWNGEYYEQIYDERHINRYQYGKGCLSDQLIGQWLSHLLNLGYLLPEKHVKKALQSIMKYNWIDLDTHVNTFRVYGVRSEKGLVICTWPHGGRPKIPVVYADEVWTGIEYQVASHLIYEGFVEEALQLVRAVRARYDGERRNPWDEIECGHHYARALSSWALILALSGFHYSAPEKTISFHPKIDSNPFRTIFVTGSSWGSYIQRKNGSITSCGLRVLHGTLELKKLRLKIGIRPQSIQVLFKGKPLIFTHGDHEEIEIALRKTLTLKSGDDLVVRVREYS